MKRIGAVVVILAIQVLLGRSAAAADCIVVGLSDSAHIAGPKVSAADLKGKVVLVEFWGRRCPPCVASLPHMQALYEKHGRNGNFTVLGAHCQDRDDETIKALLKTAKVAYPVYQFLKVEGMPEFKSIPHAALIDHKGKFVASGHIDEVLEKLPGVLQAAPLPIPGSLLGGMEIAYHKGVEQRLILGQNVEPLLKQLAAEAAADTDAGREAAGLVKQCEAALAQTEVRIREQLEQTPGQALEALALYGRTAPAKAKAFAPDMARLSANPEVKRLVDCRKDIEKLRALDPKTKSAAKTALQQAAFKKRSYASLGTSANAAVQAEAQALTADLDALMGEWTALAETKK